MRISLTSIFRNSPQHHIDRWCRQVADLGQYAQVRAVAVEGDSTDNTTERLRYAGEQAGIDLTIRHHNHGGPVWGSTEDPARMAALSGCLNACLDYRPSGCDAHVHVESDLIWAGQVLYRLALIAQSADGVVAPLVYAGDYFYDVWAFRRNGVRFESKEPLHPDVDACDRGIVLMDSVGSCLAMPNSIAHDVRVMNGNALVGWCDEARRQGHSVYCDTALRVDHPLPGDH